MKFINEDGKVVEGTPLTDRQATAVERLEEYLHDKVCGNSYHGTYSKNPCKEVARTIIPKMDDSAVGSLMAAMFEPETAPEPEQIPDPVPATPVPVDDIPF